MITQFKDNKNIKNIRTIIYCSIHRPQRVFSNQCKYYSCENWNQPEVHWHCLVPCERDQSLQILDYSGKFPQINSQFPPQETLDEGEDGEQGAGTVGIAVMLEKRKNRLLILHVVLAKVLKQCNVSPVTILSLQTLVLQQRVVSHLGKVSLLSANIPQKTDKNENLIL